MRSSSSFPVGPRLYPSIRRGAGLARGGLARTSTPASQHPGRAPSASCSGGWWKVGAGHRRGQNPAVPYTRVLLPSTGLCHIWRRVSCPSWSLWIWHHLIRAHQPVLGHHRPPAPTSRSPPFSRFPSALTSRLPRPFYLFISLWLCWAFLAGSGPSLVVSRAWPAVAAAGFSL